MHKKFINNKIKIVKPHAPDRMLLIIVFVLTGFGLMILASASAVISQERFDKPYYYFFHQLVYGVGIGLILFFIAQKIHYKFWKRLAIILFAISIITLILVFVPGLGFGYGGAKRWIGLGFFSIQPSELVKLGFIIYLAAWLEKRGEEIKTFSRSVIPFLVILGLIGLLIVAQPDIGTLGVIVAMSIIIFFTAGARISHILLIINVLHIFLIEFSYCFLNTQFS